MKNTNKPIPLLFRQNPIRSFKMWKDGFNKLTPLDHAIAKREGHLWAIFGAWTASSSLFVQSPYSTDLSSAMVKIGFGVFVSALGWLQLVEWRKEKQKVMSLKSMGEMMEEQNGIRT